jgi:hypothetical protein
LTFLFPESRNGDNPIKKLCPKKDNIEFLNFLTVRYNIKKLDCMSGFIKKSKTNISGQNRLFWIKFMS